MPVAVTARLDQALSDRIEHLCRLVEESEATVDPRPAYPPHITLAVMEADAPTGEWTEKLSALSGTINPLPIRVSHTGVFPGLSAYVFLAPVVTKALLRLHEQVVDIVPPGLLHPHHATGSWVPHITLASTRQQPAAVLATTLCDLSDFRGHITAFDLVQFPPAEVLASFPLGHSPDT